MDTKPLSRKFQEELLLYSQTENLDERRQIEKNIWAAYGAEYAVLVLDMAGFSLMTRKYGIVHYLSMVRRMQLTTEPIVKSYAGTMIKYEADNCFAIFPDPLSAVNAAIAMQHAFTASNLLTSDDLDINVACGIDYGKLLILEKEDCFGDPVNLASKLGEDIASAGEILVTKEAMEMIPSQMGVRAREIKILVSGNELPAYKIEYKENP
jgi:class 3 adenylate cyclase